MNKRTSGIQQILKEQNSNEKSSKNDLNRTVSPLVRLSDSDNPFIRKPIESNILQNIDSNFS